MGHDFDLLRLERYVADECSPDEARAVEDWAAADPARQRFLDAWRAAWQAAPTVAGFDLDAFVARVAAETYAPPREPVRELTFPHAAGRFLRTQYAGRRWWQQPRVRAAALVLAVLGGLAVWQLAPWRNTGTPPARPAAVAYREVATARGERAEVTLKDGTRIVLGPASRLRTPTQYGERGREVQLEGEAYFVVHHDAALPFRVRSRGTVTEDIGTAFVVRGYASDSALRVVVAEGRVAVRPVRALAGDTMPLVLRAHDLARVTHDGQVHTEHDVALDRYVGWTEGHLVFRDTPLRQVIPELARWYDLDIAPVDSALGGRLVTATYPTNEPATLALTAIARSLDLTVEQHGRTVRFHP